MLERLFGGSGQTVMMKQFGFETQKLLAKRVYKYLHDYFRALHFRGLDVTSGFLDVHRITSFPLTDFFQTQWTGCGFRIRC